MIDALFDCEYHHSGRRTQPKATWKAVSRRNGYTVVVCGVHMGRAWRVDPQWIVTRLPEPVR